MTFSFHPEAEAEFIGAIEYYENNERGLGYDFSIEVHAVIQNILKYPTAWPIYGRRYPAMSCKPLPLWCCLQHRRERNLILAVMHLRRHPDYWKKRQ